MAIRDFLAAQIATEAQTPSVLDVTVFGMAMKKRRLTNGQKEVITAQIAQDGNSSDYYAAFLVAICQDESGLPLFASKADVYALPHQTVIRLFKAVWT